MLHLNPLIIPDPDAPVVLDAYGDVTGPGLVVYTLNETPGGRAGLLTLVCAYRGAAVSMPSGMLPAFIVSIGFRPLGRLERRERGVKPRPEDFDLAAAVNDLGPRLRAPGAGRPANRRVRAGALVPAPEPEPHRARRVGA